MKLQYKIAIMIFGLGSIFLIGVESIYYFYSRSHQVLKVSDHLLERARERAEHIEINIIDKAHVAQAISNVPIIEEALSRSNSSFENMTDDDREKEINRLNDRWLKAIDASDPFISSHITNPVALFLKEHMERNRGKYGEIFLTNRYGTIIATTGKLTTLAHAHKYWWTAAFAEGRGRIFFDDRGFDASVEGYVIGITVPVMKDGEIIGILKCNVNMDAILLDTVQGFKLGETGSLKVARSGGLIIREKSNKPLSTRMAVTLIELMKKRGAGSIHIKDGKKALLYSYVPISITSGSTEYGFGGKHESIDHIRGNRGELWYVILSQDLSEALSPLMKELQREMSVGLLIVIIMGLVSIVIGKRLSLPIIRMENFARKVGAGNFNEHMDVRSKDELGHLALSLNAMTKDLRETTSSRDELRREIAERIKTEERIRSILTAAGEGIIVSSADSTISIVNSELCRTFGYLEKELIGQDVEIIMPKKYRKAHGEGMKRFLESGAAKVLGNRIELEGLRKDGTVFPVELKIEETGESKREDKVFVAAIRDISVRRRNESQLKIYASELEESNRIKDLFSDVMRHDLLNPVGVIMNAAEILYDKETSREKLELIGMMRDNSAQCIEMIENASMYSRIEHLHELDKKTIDLVTLLKDSIGNFVFDLQKKDMTITFEPDREYRACANRMIRDVFSNLISNAIKYGNKKTSIEISIGSDDGHLLISVRDRGNGVPDEDKEKIFERFERAGVTNIKGTGLGLAIAKRIVELHKGRIWVEDNPGGGSIFYVRILEDGINQDR